MILKWNSPQESHNNSNKIFRLTGKVHQAPMAVKAVVAADVINPFPLKIL